MSHGGSGRLFVLAWLLVFFQASLLTASEFDVVINEIHYYPAGGTTDEGELDDDDGEYVELCNRGGTAVDLGGWRLAGSELHLDFPAGTILEPKSYLVVAYSPNSIRARYGLGREVVGERFRGFLPNGGDALTLHDAEGYLISRVHYGNGEGAGEAWPSTPDGLGPSLELIDPFAQLEIPANWQPSLLAHGTPGRVNSRALEEDDIAPEETVLIEDDETWSYLKGREEFPEGWRDVAFDDSGWDSGPTGIGYSDGDDATDLDDMLNGYLSFAARKVLTLTQEEVDDLGEVELSVDYDDGFVAYLNGTEVARGNLGSAGEEMAFDDTANGSHDAGTPEPFFVSASLFVVGDNVLAVQVHNRALNSSDASFIPRLVSRPIPLPSSGPDELGPVVINEVKQPAGEDPGFVELFNRSSEELDLSDFVMERVLGGGQSTIPTGTRLLPGEFLTLLNDQLSFSIEPDTYLLLEPDGSTWVDGLEVLADGFGRFPDGAESIFVLSDPTPGAENTLTLPDGIVINEISFYPDSVSPEQDQWLELHNRSDTEYDLSGWSLNGDIQFVFVDDTVLGAGAYLVVAADAWDGSLGRRSGTVELRDGLGNVVDRVHYGNGPSEATYRGSEWPPGTSGTGSTLELVHPDLDNSFGGAWAASAPGGTPGAPNSAFNIMAPPVIGEVTHSPTVPRAGETVDVTCRVSAVDTVTEVVLFYRVDSTGFQGVIPLQDDGLTDNGVAGDGAFGGSIQLALPNRATVAFQIEASDAAGGTTRVPMPPEAPPYPSFQGPFYLYQILDASPPDNPSPSYSIIMTSADADELSSRSADSDVLLPCTFLSRPTSGPAHVCYLAGIRYGGYPPRGGDTPSFHLEFPPERTFEGLESFNLDSKDIDTEMLAADLFWRAGLPAPLVWTANVTFRGSTETRYVGKEEIDPVFLRRFFGEGGDGGSLYRSEDAILDYRGEDPEVYRPNYVKLTHVEEDDYSDIIELCRVLDPVETPDDVFADELEAIVDVWQWARYFAVQSALANAEGGIAPGDDYFLYRVPEGKWILIPYDFDDAYSGSRTERLFRPDQASIRRFLLHPRFAPVYYCNLMNVRYGVFSRVEHRQRFRLINFLFGFGTIDGIDSFITARIGFYDENIPLQLSVGAEAEAGPVLIREGDTWSYFKGTEEPSGGTLDWTLLEFDDSAWPTGPSGFGYEDGDDETVLNDMLGNYLTVYIRRPFEVEDPSTVETLELSVDYDDGFVAYLNGTEIARRNVVGDPPPFNADAEPNHEAGTPVAIDLSGFVGELVAGSNLLAIQGHNGTLDSSDFSLIPELSRPGDVVAIGCGQIIYVLGETVGLSGLANACQTRRVEVNGVEASYDPVDARWEAMVALEPGDNVVSVEAFDGAGTVIEQLEVQVRRLPEGLSVVSGELAENTVWDAASGPYLMSDSVVVPEGVTLSIEPGTVVYGQTGTSIIVRGEIDAEGTETEPIIFRAAACDNRWGGIGIDDTGVDAGDPTQLLRYCDFEFGDTASGFAGCVAPTGSKIIVDHCTFRFLTANAVEGRNSYVEVRDCLFESVHEGVHCTNSDVIVLDSTFQSIVGDKDSIDFDFNGDGRSRIERCLFLDGSDDGIDLANTSVDIRDNVFVNIQDKALSLEGAGPIGPPVVTGNLLINCGTAMALKNGVSAEGHHNTVVGSTEGLKVYDKTGGNNGADGEFHSMILWNNSFDVFVDSASTLNLTYSDVSDGLWPGEGNISEDPRFRDAQGGDFSLRPNSPCIGTGRDGTDMGAIPYEELVVLFIRGDTDESGVLELTDSVDTLNFLFQSAEPPSCLDRMDANDDSVVDIEDVLYTVFYLYFEGPEPPAPFEAEGVDPTADDGLPCY